MKKIALHFHYSHYQAIPHALIEAYGLWLIHFRIHRCQLVHRALELPIPVSN